MSVIPFYGAEDREMFAIERSAMDRPGIAIAALDRRLPNAGLVLDVGAGDGFTAQRLLSPSRTVVAVEPAAGMIDRGRRLPWVRATAQALPLGAASCDATYATWAYFFPPDPGPGLNELNRVVKPGGALLIVDNLGGDEFCSLSDREIATDPAFWAGYGFDCEPIETRFEFDSLDDARRLLGFYFGDRGYAVDRTEFTYRVGLFHSSSRGLI